MEYIANEMRISFCPVINFFIKFTVVFKAENLRITSEHQKAQKRFGENAVKFSRLNKPLNLRFDWKESACIAFVI
jgi:hypothetical protein